MCLYMYIYGYTPHHRFSDVYVKLVIGAVIEIMFGVWKCETITLALKKGLKLKRIGFCTARLCLTSDFYEVK